MVQIFAISGSAAFKGVNKDLLMTLDKALGDTFTFDHYSALGSWPLFTPENLASEEIKKVEREIAEADMVIISTPEYVHNIPAALKNLLDWTYASGVWDRKKVMPITFTPKAPRGKYAMQSLLESLKSLNAQVLVEMDLYQDELRDENGAIQIPEEVLSCIQQFLQA